MRCSNFICLSKIIVDNMHNAYFRPFLNCSVFATSLSTSGRPLHGCNHRIVLDSDFYIYNIKLLPHNFAAHVLLNVVHEKTKGKVF